MDVLDWVAFYGTPADAEKAAERLRQNAKVKTDVFRILLDPENGYYIEQDVA